MKTFNVIDFGIQTLIIGSVILAALFSIPDGNFDSIATFFVWGAFFLGPWQLLSSLVTTLSRWPLWNLRLIHLLTSIVFLVILSLLAAYGDQSDFNPMVGDLGNGLGFAIPGILAAFYFSITIKTFTLLKQKRAVPA
jgi:hypothetical protein